MLSRFKLTQITDLNSSCLSLFLELRNSVDELVDGARKAPEPAIHEIRKKLKMIRAFLKMSRSGMAENRYEEANIHYRNIGRILSEIRDAHSRRQLLLRLETESATTQARELFLELRTINEDEICKLEQIHLVDFDIFKRVEMKLKAPESDLFLKDFSLSAGLLTDGISRTYESGFNAFFTSLLCPTPELLHEWRKKLKDLQSQATYINDVADLSPHIDIQELDELADHLGDIQDFNVTREWLSHLPLNKSAFAEADKLKKLLKSRQEKLLKKTEYLGKSIYRLEPDRFKQQLQALLSR